jgi:hypothetical protein
MTTVEQIIEAACDNDNYDVNVNDAAEALFDAVRAGTVTKESFVSMIGDLTDSAHQRGVFSTYED